MSPRQESLRKQDIWENADEETRTLKQVLSQCNYITSNAHSHRSLAKVSEDKYNHEIGYESLLADFKRYRKQCPRGVSLARDRSSILLQFKIGDKSRSKYGCNCSFTLDGMVSALSKAKKVSEALKTSTSESEFWEWYNKEIKEVGKIENDLLTFRDAIAIVELVFRLSDKLLARKRSIIETVIDQLKNFSQIEVRPRVEPL